MIKAFPIWGHLIFTSSLFSVDEKEQDIVLYGFKILETWLEKDVCRTNWEQLYQVPCEPRLIVKITEYLESLVSVISDGVQSRGGEPGCFIILTASSQLNLAVFTNKRYRVGTVVPNTCWLTELITGSSIEIRVFPAARIGTRDVISTWNGVVRSLIIMILIWV